MISSYVFRDLMKMPQVLNLSGVCPQFGIFTLSFIDEQDKQPLHLAFRIDARQIAVNDNLTGSWGAELHVNDLDFPLGLPFELTIELRQDRVIRLSMDGKLLQEFKWRCDPATAVRLDMAGGDFSLYRDDREVQTLPEQIPPRQQVASEVAPADAGIDQLMRHLHELHNDQRGTREDLNARLEQLTGEIAELRKLVAGIGVSVQALISHDVGAQGTSKAPPVKPAAPAPSPQPAQTKKKVAVDDQFVKGWGAWRHHQNVKLGELGLFTLNQDRSTPGIERQPIAVEPSTYYQFSIAGNFKASSKKTFLAAYDPDNDLVLTAARYIENEPGSASQIFMTTGRTKRLVLRVLVEAPKPGDECRIESAKLENLGRADLYTPAQMKQGSREKICASMASVAGRDEMVVDAVLSLYPFVDKVRVYLNGYDKVPEGLKLPRVEIARSQQYGDDGDAGKFFWVENKEFNLNLVCDDDMMYPADYAEKMVAALARYDNKAVVGLHGILLKQPTPAYYNEKHRHVRRFLHATDADYQVHILGTGAILYDARTLKLSRRDFQYRNMGDIWLMQQAQAQGVPAVCIARPRNWVIQNNASTAVPTIYNASHGKTGGGFDTSSVQTAMVKDAWPITMQPLVQKGERRQKIVMSITTWNRCDYLKDCIDSFARTCSNEYDWVLMIADDGSTDGTLEYLDNLQLPHEVHIIRNKGRYACGQTNTIFELCQKIGFDFAFKIDDDILFKKRGWDKVYIDAARASGYPHLCHRNWQQFTTLKRRNKPDYAPPPPHMDGSGHCETIVGVWECDGCLFTFTSEMIDKVGFCDENNFPIRGQWHIDYSIRCCRAGFNDPKYFYDARDSNQYIELQANKPTYRCSLPWGDEYKKTKDPAELTRREKVMRDESRVYIPLPASKTAPVVAVRRRSTVNEFFDKVYVLNLDRRQDRLTMVERQTEKLGIKFERFPAVDGKMKPFIDEWLAYSQKPLVQMPEGVKKLTRSKDFYQGYDSPIARVAFIEAKLQKKAIRSAGAWGYLKSYVGMLEKALNEGYESVLILDDDALFHRDFKTLFAAAVRELPEDWKIFQLGALQYDWGDDWITKYSEHLYQCNGSSVGSHATGIHRSVIPALLHQASTFDMALDVGPLCQVKRAYAEKSFTVLPNLIIQDTSESDIASSDVQQAEGQKRANVYRWVLEDYPAPTELADARPPVAERKSAGIRA